MKDQRALILLALVALAVGLIAIWQEQRELSARVDRIEQRAQGAMAPRAAHGGAPLIRHPGEEPACTGIVTGAAVQRTLGASGHAVFDCYEQRRQAAPGLAGPLRLSLRVDAEGRVVKATVTGIADGELRRCVGDRVLQWQFDAPHDGLCAIVELPFVLSPRDAGAATHAL